MHEGDPDVTLPERTSPLSRSGKNSNGPEPPSLTVRGVSSSPVSPYGSATTSPVASASNRKRPLPGPDGSADAGIHSRVNSATSELGGRSDTPLVPLASPTSLSKKHI